MEGEPGERKAIERRVRDWLRSSGNMGHIQARLRADLYSALQGNPASSLKLRPRSSPLSVSTQYRAINWLVSQHLTSQQCWLTNSVLASEAELPGDINPPGVGITGQVGSGGKQYGTEVVSRETLLSLLSQLGLNHGKLVDRVVESYLAQCGVSVLGLIINGLIQDKAVEQDRPTAQVPSRVQPGEGETQVETVQGRMEHIEEKYHRILQDLGQQRRAAAFQQYQPGIQGRNLVEIDQPAVKRQAIEIPDREEDIRSRKREEKEGRRRREKENQLKKQDSLAETSSIATEGSINHGKTADVNEVSSKDVTIRKLCQKLEEFLTVQEQERETVKRLEGSLQEAQEEVRRLKGRLKEEEKRRMEGEQVVEMTQLVTQQMSQALSKEEVDIDDAFEDFNQLSLQE